MDDDAGIPTDAGATETVLFEDDFDQPGIPDPSFWSLVESGQSGWNRYMSGSYDQAFVQDGKLILKGEMVGGVYKASGLTTSGKFSFAYGRVEVRAKLNSAQGGWPAIWMMPEASEGWPDSGDITVMQQVNHEAFVRSSINSRYTVTLGHSADPASSVTAPYDVNQFNTYSLEWTPEALVFSVNGTVSLTYPNLHLSDEGAQMQWPFNKPFFIILDFALGGPDTPPGPITDAELPASMEVDWVRVTRRNLVSVADGGTADAGIDEASDAGIDFDAGIDDDAGAAVDGGARVLFEEDFSQSGTPDSTKWSLCPRGGSNWDRYMSGTNDQAYVENGRLIVVGEKVGSEYLTGGVLTRGKFSFTYGKVEVSARFNEAQGGWPAIWLMPEGSHDWPTCGEIDIMEQVSHETVFHATIHSNWRNTLGNYENPPSSVQPPYNLGQFNTYGLAWSPEELVFSVNGTETLRYPNLHRADEATVQQWPFNKPFYIILNYALGGAGTWPGEITDSELPGRMEVDWVKVTEL